MVHMFIYWLILIIESLYIVFCYCAYESFIFQNCVLELYFLFTGPVFYTLCYAKRNIATIKINSIFFSSTLCHSLVCFAFQPWEIHTTFYPLEFQFFSFLVKEKSVFTIFHSVPLSWSGHLLHGIFLLFPGDVLSLSTPVSCSNLKQYVLDCLHSLHANTSLSPFLSLMLSWISDLPWISPIHY